MSQEELQHQLEQIIEPIEKLRGESVIKKIIFKMKLIAHRKNIKKSLFFEEYYKRRLKIICNKLLMTFRKLVTPKLEKGDFHKCQKSM